MQAFDIQRFMQQRSGSWEELERILARLEESGHKTLGLEEARRFGKLYRSVSSDLIRARTELVDAALMDYLNDLVARSYAIIYAGSLTRKRGRVRAFLLQSFPQLVREEWKPIVLAATVLLAGGFFGALATALDPSSASVLIPEPHQSMTPEERIARDASKSMDDSHQAVAFSTFLFTHNIGVTFLVFALGITAGVGTLAVLFANGIPLGALAMQYQQASAGTFFWAWILPHGVPELTVVFIAGGAGLIIARGILLPGSRRRRDAIVREAKRAAQLVLGGMPILVLAGLVEGTISQIHPPRIGAWVKLLVAAIIAVGVYGYLLFSGARTPNSAFDRGGARGRERPRMR